MTNSRISGFYNMTLVQRRAKLGEEAAQSPDSLLPFTSGGLSPEAADHMIENVIGFYSLPLGIALNFMVNGRDELVPKTLEEPSVVAGASFMAKQARTGGGYTATTTDPLMIGQMQVIHIHNLEEARLKLYEHKAELLAEADSIDPILKKFGGGARDLVAILVLLFPASGDTPLLAENLPTLLVAGAVIAAALLALVGWRLWHLRRRIRAGVFGGKLTFRLMLWFGLVALLPATVVFGASVFFLNRSIETWFDVRVDTALGSGVNLGQAALDDLLDDLTKKTERMAVALSDAGAGSVITMLSTLRAQAAINEATLFDEKGGVVATAAGEKASLLPEIPDKTILWQVLQAKAYSRVDDLPGKGLVMRVLVPVYSTSFAGETRVLQVLHAVPPSLAKDAEAVQSAYRDYQEIAASRLGLKRLYGVALTLTLLLALLLTIALAYLLSERLGAPLRTLVRGTRAVAKGDFSQKQAVESRDELGALIQSFNNMTRQVADARGEAERNHLQTEHAKAYLESVLAILSSGVVALDHKLRVRAINDAAARILETGIEDLAGRPLVEWGEPDTPLRTFGETAAERFVSAEGGDWQAQLEFRSRARAAATAAGRGRRAPARRQRTAV